MNVITMFLPIIVMVVVLVLMFFLGNKVLTFTKKIWTVKRIAIIIVCYIAIGLASMALLMITAKDENKLVEKEELQTLLDDQQLNWELIDQNRLDELNDKYLIREWSYKLPTNELEVRYEGEDEYYPGQFIVVKWRDEPNSNDIYAKKFKMPYIFDGIDVTKRLPEVPMEFRNSELVIEDIAETKVTLYKLEPTVKMIKNFRSWDLENEDIYNYVTGNYILYLNVPKHINIIDRYGFIHYPSTY